jgi:hypothetical protein
MDSRKCQTATASPAEPGELPGGLAPSIVNQNLYMDITGENAWIVCIWRHDEMRKGNRTRMQAAILRVPRLLFKVFPSSNCAR